MSSGFVLGSGSSVDVVSVHKDCVVFKNSVISMDCTTIDNDSSVKVVSTKDSSVKSSDFKNSSVKCHDMKDSSVKSCIMKDSSSHMDCAIHDNSCTLFAHSGAPACILHNCCDDCGFCKRVFKRAAATRKTHSDFNKPCERCFYCKSIHICPTCIRCSKCCAKSTCRGQTSTILGSLAGPKCIPQSGRNTKGGIHPSLQSSTTTDKRSDHSEWLCICPQARLPDGGIACTLGQKCSRKGQSEKLSSLFQQTVSSAETQPQVEAHTGSFCPKQIFESGQFQDGNSREHKNLSSQRRMGNVHRLQGRLLPHSNPSKVKKVPKISCQRSILPVQSTALWPLNSSNGVHHSGQRGKTHSSSSRYKNPPVPRRLVGQSSLKARMPGSNSSSSANLPTTRLVSKSGQIRAYTQTGLQLCRVPIRPSHGKGQTHSREMGSLTEQNQCSAVKRSVPGQRVDVTHRPIDSHREASTVGPVAHETHTVAFESSLESSRDTGKMDSGPSFNPPTFEMVDGPGQCPVGPTPASFGAFSSDLHGCLQGGLGSPHRRPHGQGSLVYSRDQAPYQSLRTQGSSPGPQAISGLGYRKDSVDSHRQHDSGCLYQQGGRHEVRGPLCPAVENHGLVRQACSDSQSQTYSRSPQCSGRQALQTGTSHPDGMVPSSSSVLGDMQQVAHTSGRPVCDQVQPETATVCVPGARPNSLGSGRSQHLVGGLRSLSLSPHSPSGQGDVQNQGQPVQEGHCDSPGLAQDAMVLT